MTMVNTVMRVLAESANDNAKKHGWWGTDATWIDEIKRLAAMPEIPKDSSNTARLVSVVSEKLLMIHSEVSEATEELRGLKLKLYMVDGKPEGLVVELADVVIRIADLCGALGLDLGNAIQLKMEYNTRRSYRHGGKAL